jgi:hypothetical protein
MSARQLAPLILLAQLHRSGEPADRQADADRPPDAPPRRLHDQLRVNARHWLAEQERAAGGLPEALTAGAMMEALGCGDGAFQRWAAAGLLPGGRTTWREPWRCTTATFIAWLGCDASWFAPGEAGSMTEEPVPLPPDPRARAAVPPLPDPLDGVALHQWMTTLVERARAERWAMDGAPVPRYLRRRRQLHQRLRTHAVGWLQAQLEAAGTLPLVVTPEEMRAALGCELPAFYQWREQGLLPGAQVLPGGCWRCTTAAFVGWLTLDRYWFGTAPGGSSC